MKERKGLIKVMAGLILTIGMTVGVMLGMTVSAKAADYHPEGRMSKMLEK